MFIIKEEAKRMSAKEVEDGIEFSIENSEGEDIPICRINNEGYLLLYKKLPKDLGFKLLEDGSIKTEVY